MNSIMTDYFPILQEYQTIRSALIGALFDQDLAYTPGGTNMPLGALCRELGEVQHAYIQSFKTFALDFSYRNGSPGLEQTVAMLAAWYAELDAELQAAVEGLSQEDIEQRRIDRGGNFTLPPQIQLEVYKEALLIFYGKASVYMKALGKTLPPQMQDWIG